MRPLALLRVFAGFALAISANSCNDPAKPDGEVRTVTARDLVRQYREDPDAARLAFTEQEVSVWVTGGDVVGNELRWSPVFVTPRQPPPLVFQFSDAPTIRFPAYLTGHCTGRHPDSRVPGYGFVVRVVGCKVSP